MFSLYKAAVGRKYKILGRTRNYLLGENSVGYSIGPAVDRKYKIKPKINVDLRFSVTARHYNR